MNINKNIFNIYEFNLNINKKLLISKNNDILIHNNIYNKFIQNVKNEKRMDEKYFKVLLTIVYKKIFKKNIIYKNIKHDLLLQDNINNILFNYSFIRLYDILLNNGESLSKEVIENITTLFYSTLFLNYETN